MVTSYFVGLILITLIIIRVIAMQSEDESLRSMWPTTTSPSTNPQCLSDTEYTRTWDGRSDDDDDDKLCVY